MGKDAPQDENIENTGIIVHSTYWNSLQDTGREALLLL